MMKMDDKKFIADYGAMIAGGKTLWIEGCFNYWTFGGWHRSAFCYFRKPLPRGEIKVGTIVDLLFSECPNPGSAFAD
jgi:hypothetical protein